MKQRTMIPLTFRYKEEEDGHIKEAVEALGKLQDTSYYGRSISDIVRIIFVPAFRNQARQRLGRAALKKYGLE